MTADQRRIVEWGDGPLVVIAGAGTGKTRVIVERVRWLLETKGAGTRDAEGRLVAERARDPRPALRRPADPRADPRPDLQREGRAGAPGSAGPGRRAGGARPDDGHELPQLLPADPDRVGGGCRPAAAPGRARRRRPGAAAQGHPAAAHAHLPLGLVAERHRPVHQPGQGRARDAGRLRRLRRQRAPRLRGALRELRGRRGPPREPGQPRAAARGSGRLRGPPRERARRGPGRGAQLRHPGRRQGRRPRGPAHDRRHRLCAVSRPVRPRRPPADRCPRRRPTSSMAPPWRSCG